MKLSSIFKKTITMQNNAIIVIDKTSFDWPSERALPSTGDVIHIYNSDTDKYESYIVTKIVHSVSCGKGKSKFTTSARIHVNRAKVSDFIDNLPAKIQEPLQALKRASKHKLLYESVTEAIKLAREDSSMPIDNVIINAVNEWCK